MYDRIRSVPDTDSLYWSLGAPCTVSHSMKREGARIPGAGSCRRRTQWRPSEGLSRSTSVAAIEEASWIKCEAASPAAVHAPAFALARSRAPHAGLHPRKQRRTGVAVAPGENRGGPEGESTRWLRWAESSARRATSESEVGWTPVCQNWRNGAYPRGISLWLAGPISSSFSPFFLGTPFGSLMSCFFFNYSYSPRLNFSI